MTAWRSAAWILLIFIACCPHAAEGKWQQDFVRFGPEGPPLGGRWRYLTKFSFGVGKNTWQFRFQALKGGERDTHDTDAYPDPMPKRTRAVLELHRSDNWARVESQPKVCQRKQLTNISMEISAPIVGREYEDWSPWYNGTIEHTRQPHMWFFTMSLCNNKSWNLTTQEYNMTLKMRFEFRALQANGSEFSHEIYWVPTMTAIFLMAKTAFFVFVVNRCRAMGKIVGQIHPVMWTLIAIIIMQFLSQVVHSVHIAWYAEDGQGWHKLESISEMLEMLSQVMLSSLLILIALGYTLLQSKIEGGLQDTMPFCLVIGLIHVLFVGFAKIQEDGGHMTHKHNNASGWFLVVFRAMLYLWFLWAVRSTKAVVKDAQLSAFLDKFKFAGSLYFLAYPLVFFTGHLLFAPHHQQKIMTGGWMIMHIASNIYLASLFLGTGEYFQVSSLSANFLPGGANKTD